MIVSTHDLLIMIGCALASGVGLTALGMLIEFALRKKHPAPLPEAAERPAAEPPAPRAAPPPRRRRPVPSPAMEAPPPEVGQPVAPPRAALPPAPPGRRAGGGTAAGSSSSATPARCRASRCRSTGRRRRGHARRFPLSPGPTQDPRQFSRAAACRGRRWRQGRGDLPRAWRRR